MAARPGLVYWNGTTIKCLHRVRELRDAGVPVFFTIDAGPQLKAICEPGSADRVATALAEIPGVVRVLRCGLGDGARVIEGGR
jgi:diphosphomevalonate decarboxylase